MWNASAKKSIECVCRHAQSTCLNIILYGHTLFFFCVLPNEMRSIWIASSMQTLAHTISVVFAFGGILFVETKFVWHTRTKSITVPQFIMCVNSLTYWDREYPISNCIQVLLRLFISFSLSVFLSSCFFLAICITFFLVAVHRFYFCL